MIVFLLVGFSSISQTNIQKDSVVILTENQARAIITDLIHYDYSKQIIKEQEIRIKNYQNKESEFKNKLNIKDSIIFYQKSIIDIQKNVIKKSKPFEIHGYAGIQSMQFTLKKPIMYANVMLEFTKFSAGAQYYVQPNSPSGYGIILEYNLF